MAADITGANRVNLSADRLCLPDIAFMLECPDMLNGDPLCRFRPYCQERAALEAADDARISNMVSS